MRRWLFRFLSLVLILFVVVCAGIWLVEFYPRHGSHPPLQLGRGTLAIQHARIYVAPSDPPIEDGTVLIRDGRIAAVGAQVEIPSGSTIVPCDHCVVTAGFWNAHVHLTEPKWSMANWKSAATLNPQLADMFLSRGFTTVIDLGSNPADTFSIRRRTEKGELTGPYIYTAGTGIYPPHGIPFYLKETLPRWIQASMPQPETPQEATSIVHRNLGGGADLTKLFTGSWVERGHVLPMPVNIATAAVTESHLNGKLVFAHPSSRGSLCPDARERSGVLRFAEGPEVDVRLDGVAVVRVAVVVDGAANATTGTPGPGCCGCGDGTRPGVELNSSRNWSSRKRGVRGTRSMRTA